MFTDKINKALKEKGISKVWLASKLGIHRSSLNLKMKNNTYSVSDIHYITNLLSLED